MTVLVCAAHADDEIIGCGATIAKLAKTEKVVVVIFTYSSKNAGMFTSWPPFMDEETLKRRRIRESIKAGEMLGVSETFFLGIHGEIDEEFNYSKKEMLESIIKKYRPRKIFYHSSDDMHPDHVAVNRIMSDVLKKMKKKPEVYQFQVNLFGYDKKKPEIIMDVSNEFPLKLKALSCFSSQIISIYLLKPLIMMKGIMYGRKHGFKYAEYFYGE